MTLKSKLIALSLSIILCFTLIIWLHFIPIYKETLILKKKEQLQSTMNQLITTMDHAMISHGSTEEHMKELVQDIRYGDSGKEYFLLLKPNGILALHPLESNLNDKDVSKVKDPLGFPLVEHYLKIGNIDGQGFLTYNWAYYGDKNNVQPKLAFIYKYKKMDTIIIATIYLNDVEEYINQLKFNSCVAITIGSLWAMVFSFFLIRNFIKSIKNITRRLQELNDDNDGNLSKNLDIKTKDELGDLSIIFNTFLDKIRKIILTTINVNKELNIQCKQLSEYIQRFHEISNDGSTLSLTMSNKFGNFHKSIDKLTDGINQNVSDINQANSSTQGLTSIITEISRQTSTTQSLANDVQDLMKNIESALQSLIRNHDDVDKVVTTIALITEQTSLLALNARIEAARALEAGKGFAVVAEEINTLAKESGEATIEINGIIQKTKEETVNSIRAINDIFSKTVDIVNNITSIASAIEEQSIASMEISKKLIGIDTAMLNMKNESGKITTETIELEEDLKTVNEHFQHIDRLKEELIENISDLNKVKDNLQITLSKFKL